MVADGQDPQRQWVQMGHGNWHQTHTAPNFGHNVHQQLGFPPGPPQQFPGVPWQNLYVPGPTMQMNANQGQYFHHSPMSAIAPQHYMGTPQRQGYQTAPPQMQGLHARFQSAATPSPHPMQHSPNHSTSNAPIHHTPPMQGYYGESPYIGYAASIFHGQMGPGAGGFGQGERFSGGQSPYGRASAIPIIDPNDNAANGAAPFDNGYTEWQRRQHASAEHPYASERDQRPYSSGTTMPETPRSTSGPGSAAGGGSFTPTPPQAPETSPPDVPGDPNDPTAFLKLLKDLIASNHATTATLAQAIMQSQTSPRAGASPFESTTKMPRILETSFNAEEIRNHPLTLEVTEWQQELQDFFDYIIHKHATVQAAVLLTDAQWDSMRCQGTEQMQLLQAADAYLARQMLLCMGNTSDRVKNFKNFIHGDLDARSSGRNLVSRLIAFETPRTKPERDAIKNRYDKGKFFALGMSKDAAEIAVQDCIAAFSANPNRSSGPYAVHEALLDKIPQIRNDDPDDPLRVVMQNARAYILDAELGEPPSSKLTMKNFTATLAHAIAGSRPAPLARADVPRGGNRWFNSKRVEANFCDKGTDCQNEACQAHWTSVCDDDESHGSLDFDASEASRPPADAAAADGVQRTCWDCGGKIPQDHPMRQCNKVCKSCGTSPCPGNRGLPCAVAGKETITEDSKIPNGAGMNLRGRSLRMLITRQQEMRKGEAGRKARNAAQAAVEAYASELGVSASKFDLDAEFNTLDQVHVLGGVLELEAPKAESCAALNPPAQIVVESTEGQECSKGEANATEANASVKEERKGQWIYAMLDSGTNCHVGVLPSAARYTSSYSPCSGSIGGQGKGQATQIAGKMDTAPFVFETGKHAALEEVYDSPGSRKFLLDEVALYKQMGARVNLDTNKLEFKDGSEPVPLYQRGDHRNWIRIFIPVANESVPCTGVETTFHDKSMSGLDANSADATPDHALDANVASIATTSALLLMAARFNVSAKGLEGVTNGIDGMAAPKMDVETRRLIDADVHRRASIQKRAAAPQFNPGRATQPGHTIAFDGFGPMAAQSVVGNHTYQMISVCVASALVGTGETKKHDSTTWVPFISSTFRKFRAWMRECFFARFDRAGEFTKGTFAPQVEKEAQVTVQLGSSKWHEAVALPEVTNDILSRIAEGMCARASLGPSYFLQARKHAAFLLNLRPRRGQSISRLEVASGIKPTKSAANTYIFGCQVIVLRDKDDRGVHGSLDKGRTFMCRYLGRDGAGHCVQKLDTGAILYPSHCIPVNEHELIRDSMPPMAALHSVEVQTGTNDAPSSNPVQQASTLPQILGNNGTSPASINANTPDGSDMKFGFFFGGHDDTIDNIQQRLKLRYPMSVSWNRDYKNDRIKYDMTQRAARREGFEKLDEGGLTAVMISMPCTTYGNCLGVQMRGTGKQTIWGLPGLEPRLAQLVKDHNILSHFSQDVIEYCDIRKIPWMVECAPARDNPALDTAWEEFAEWGTFWHQPRIQALERRKVRPAKRYILARCEFEEPPQAQKYYEVMLSFELQPEGDRRLPRSCSHMWHPLKVRGKTMDGFWISQQLEEYPPLMADEFACILASPGIPSNAQPAPTPPFSTEQRPTNVPVSRLHSTIMPEPQTLACSVQEAMDDALIAYDGEMTAGLDAALAEAYEPKPTAMPQNATMEPMAPPSKFELSS